MKHLKTICNEVYNQSGIGGVIDYIEERFEKEPLTKTIVNYEDCKQCESETPHWKGEECLICGRQN